MMKKAIIGAFVSLASLCSLAAAPALAFSPNPNPGYLHNCVGFTTSYVTHGNDISPFNSATGMGNVAAANDVTTQQAMDYIKDVVCA